MSDYEKLIKILQEDNLNLERERAELKHKLKLQSMMYSAQPSQRYADLNDDEKLEVDNFILRMRSG
jgi:hypothetical protein